MGELPPGIDTSNLDELLASLTPSTIKALGQTRGRCWAAATAVRRSSTALWVWNAVVVDLFRCGSCWCSASECSQVEIHVCFD